MGTVKDLFPEITKVAMSPIGTTRTFCNVRYSVAVGCKAEIVGSL
jgi:hypothetical protein